ncbi:unnamed protein product [Lactuca virosa]|uniref:Uncharacterized protein n=1 Tax=Lactuca virosa TaxID=75947 RepID=A0AAU9N782_9ASTR|nr:unnamed protein product [Lactuca virosa]
MRMTNTAAPPPFTSFSPFQRFLRFIVAVPVEHRSAAIHLLRFPTLLRRRYSSSLLSGIRRRRRRLRTSSKVSTMMDENEADSSISM